MAAVIPAVTRISTTIIRILGCNPGAETLQGTNTYILGTGKRRILIDCGEADVPQYINHLRAVLKYEGIDLAHIFITHGHEEHIGGLIDIFEHIPGRTKHCQVWKYPTLKNVDVTLPRAIDFNNLKDGQEFAVEGATIRVIHTPGRSDDHVAFFLVEENALFSGDCILGDCTFSEGAVEIDDLYDHLHSLGEITKLNPTTVYPGHGNVIHNPLGTIQYYMQHRMQRERQIIDVLLSNSSQAFNNEDLVKLIYQNLPQKLLRTAANNVYHHLLKLLKEDRVRNCNGKWQIKDVQLVATC